MDKLFDERFEINELSVNTVTYSEHLVRYLFAASYVKNKVVLDIASGTGYGSQILAKSGAKSVIGVDLEEEAVKKASSLNKYKNVEYINSDACNLRLANKTFDLIVSFETIEHIKDCKKYLSELRRVLRNDGLLLISTPNVKISKAKNPFHYKEFTKEEFQELLSDKFKRVEILDQVNGIASVIRGGRECAQINVGDSKEPEYFVAICGDSNFKLNGGVGSVNPQALAKIRANPGLIIVDAIYSMLVKIPGINMLFKG